MWNGRLVVGFWLLSRSRHVSRCARSVPSDQRTQHVSRPSIGPRRKSRVLSRAHTHLELPTRIRDYQVPLRDPNDRRSSTMDAQLGRGCPASWGPQPPPPWRLPPLRLLQLSSTIPAIHEFSYAARSSPHTKCYNVPTSMRGVMDSDRYLCIMIPMIKWCDLGSCEKITMWKTCSYWDPKYWHHQLQLQQEIYTSISMEKEVSFWLSSKKLHEYAFACLYSKWGFSFSRPRVFGQHHTGAPDLKDILFFSIFLAGSIGSV